MFWQARRRRFTIQSFSKYRSPENGRALRHLRFASRHEKLHHIFPDCLYLLGLDGKILNKWAVEKIVPRGGMSGNVRLDASPDGRTLLMDVEMDEKERKGWDGPPPSIWTLDLTTGRSTRLTPKTLYAWDCHWLDAPGSIVFSSQGPNEKSPSIYTMTTAGQGKDRKLLIKNARTPSTSR